VPRMPELSLEHCGVESSRRVSNLERGTIGCKERDKESEKRNKVEGRDMV